MGVSHTYMRMAVEEEREAAREVGLPSSTSLARSCWTKVQNTKSKDWTRQNLKKEVFLAIDSNIETGRRPTFV